MSLAPFYFCWVDSDQTEFDPDTMNVIDENVFEFTMLHEEGQTPTLDITIQNSRVGLLAPGRKVWAWLAYQPPSGSGIIPIFFGVLVGIPTNLFAELITLKFISRSETYIEDKQAVAETMKTQPYYDPVFLDEKHRDEPDSILEGWSSLWHVDRTSLATSASDILEGEDGNIVFQEADAFYDSVSMSLNEAPLANIQVQATVNWTQRSIGYVNGPNVNINSYTGDTFMSGWPKPGAGLGGGWRVETSFVDDVYKVSQTPMSSVSDSWTNNDPTAGDCSTQAISNSSSWPALLSPNPLSYILTDQSQSGLCDPYGSPPDVPPTNRPATVHVTGTIVPMWTLNCTWTLRYDAKREYSEFLVMDVKANTQGILTSPTVQQNTELMTISGTNVGEPLLELDAWSDWAGLSVPLATMIYPNNPTQPGGLSYQVCVVAGTAGTVEPVFSDVPGTITIDGTVQWASMGESPLTDQPNWSQASNVPLGEIICYEPVAFNEAAGDLQSTGQSTYYLCTTSGETNSTYTEITYIPPVTNNDEPTPAPVNFFYIAGPAFSTVPGALITDGTVQWTCLGQQPSFLGIPIGGTADNVTARSYFPTDRGQRSIQYLICKARARLRLRARAVKVSWDCPFDLALGVSCRHSATLYDPRLPGGVATGKVISYSLKASGDGELIGHVEVGCAVGFGGSVLAITGTPEYTAGTGYCQPGYQRYDGSQYALPEEDIAYTPPVFAAFDDGLSFPLTTLPAVGSISGSTAEQAAAILAAVPVTQYLNNLGNQFQTNTTPGADGSGSITGFSPAAAWWKEEQQIYNESHAVPYVMEANPVSYEILIEPVVNGPFNGAYEVTVTTLEIPQGVNLEAPSSP